VVVGLVFSIVLPVHQTLERSIIIKAPASDVFDQLVKLKNFNKWSVWNNQDSSIKITYSGADGTVGATTTWSGDPAISGEGKIEIKEIEKDRRIVQAIQFISPEKVNATSTFSLEENKGITTVTWNFRLHTPRPWNIFNLFHSMEKQMGNDFEKSLAALKRDIQKDTLASHDFYKQELLNFPTTTFALVRQTVKFSDIDSFYSKHISVLINETTRLQISGGTPACLFFNRDEYNQLADMAAAIPVPPGTVIQSSIVQVMEIPASKAVVVTYHGGYDNMMNAYKRLDQYFLDNGLTKKMPAIEQYISGPFSEKDTVKWLTKIVYLAE